MKTRIFFLVMLVLSSVAFAQTDRGARGEPVPVTGNEDLRWLDTALFNSGFIFNEQVKTAFYDHCLRLISNDLKLSESTWEWLNEHPAVFNATFAVSYPPNANIVHNFVKLAKVVGPYYAEKYQHLLIAFAVRYRDRRLLEGTITDDKYGFTQSRNYTWDPDYKARLERDVLSQNGWAINHDINLEDYKFEGDGKGNYFPDQEQKRNHLMTLDKMFDLGDDGEAKSTVKWLRENKKTQIYELIAMSPGQFYNKTGIRLKEGRQPKSLPWDKIAHVARRYPPRMKGLIVDNLCLRIQRYEERGAERSKLFPLSKTPWPLLLLLTQEDPIDESTYWWNYYKGKGEVPGYATYSFDYMKPEIRYHDGVWHPDATPRILVDGGVCGRLSTMAEFAQRSIGTPAQGMGQPGHRAFMTYSYRNGKFNVDMQHSVNTIDVSTVGWDLPPLYGPVTDPKTKETGFALMLPHNSDAFMRQNVRWHIGLCEAMNIGLASWEDSRMAMHILDIYEAAGASQNQVLAMLRSAMAVNIANTDVVFRMAKARKGDARRIQDLMQGFANMFVSVQDGCTSDSPLALNTNFGNTQAGADLSAILNSTFTPTIRNTKKVKNEWALFVRQAIFLGAFTNIPDVNDPQYDPKRRGNAGWIIDKNAYAKAVAEELKYQKKLGNSPFLAEVQRLNDKYDKVRLAAETDRTRNVKEERERRQAAENAW